MKKQNEFIKNTLILFIGKFCLQFISFLLLPIYTHYLLANDYGLVDLITTYISLFVPILILKLDSSIFRFLIDARNNDEDKISIISNSFLVLFIQLILFTIVYLIIINVFNIKYSLLIGINIIVLMISSILLQSVRGLGKLIDYSIASIITGIIKLIVDIILIIFFKFNASSILIASIIANVFCSIYIFFKDKIYRYISVNRVTFRKIKELLTYSLPMIPNSLSWWIVGVSDRTIISIFINTAANGIYTIASKFSNILNSIFTIVNMSWQETASLHINDEDKDIFFSKMINNIWVFFISISNLIIIFLPVFFNILIGHEYLESYNYVPILLYANIWSVLIGLIGGIYIACKKTKEVAITTIMSALINLVINILFIKKFKLYAASISTLVAYMTMGIYRVIACRKIINITFDLKKVLSSMGIFILSSLVYYINIKSLNIFSLIILLPLLILINKKYIIFCKNFFVKKLKVKKG